VRPDLLLEVPGVLGIGKDAAAQEQADPRPARGLKGQMESRLGGDAPHREHEIVLRCPGREDVQGDAARNHRDGGVFGEEPAREMRGARQERQGPRGPGHIRGIERGRQIEAGQNRRTGVGKIAPEVDAVHVNDVDLEILHQARDQLTVDLMERVPGGGVHRTLGRGCGKKRPRDDRPRTGEHEGSMPASDEALVQKAQSLGRAPNGVRSDGGQRIRDGEDGERH
jgi:hypothetical protein